MTVNPYQSPQVPSIRQDIEEPKQVRWRTRVLAIVFFIAGTFIGGWGIWLIGNQLENIAVGIVPVMHLLAFAVFAMSVLGLGAGMITLGIDRWRGTKNLAWITAILFAPFALAFCAVILVTLGALIYSLFTG